MTFGDSTPPPPVDSAPLGADDDDMKNRIQKLEELAADARERLVRIETRLEGVDLRMATKEELQREMHAVRGDINSIRTTDFRLTFGAIIFVALGLAGLMAKGFGWL